MVVRGKYTERLHPRGRGGKFIKGLPKLQTVKDRNRAISTLARFRHHVLDRRTAGQYHTHHGPAVEHQPAVARYFAGGYKDINAAMREGNDHPDIDAVAAAFKPLPHDLVVSRRVEPAAFGLDGPEGIKDLVGKKVADTAYQAASLHDEQGQPGITMHIAVPKGVPAVLSEDGQILLDRDTELAIVDATPNGRDGWDVHAVLLKKPVTRAKKAEPGPIPQSTVKPKVDERDLSKLTVPQLQAKVREAGKKPGRLRKAELVALLQAKPAAPKPTQVEPKPDLAADANAHTTTKAAIPTLPATTPGLRDYAEYGKLVNDHLRGTTDEKHVRISKELSDRITDDLDRMFSTVQPLQGDAVVYRGLVEHESVALRQERTLFGDESAVGKTFTDPAFGSTSPTRSSAEIFAQTGRRGSTIIQIRIPKGQKAVKITGNLDREDEVLLPRNYTIRVTKDEIGSDKVRRMEADLLPSTEGRSEPVTAAPRPKAPVNAVKPSVKRRDPKAATPAKAEPDLATAAGRMQARYGERLRVKPEMDTWKRNEALKRLDTMPDRAHELLNEHFASGPPGAGFYLGHGSVTQSGSESFARRAGVRPPGWAAGSSWDDAIGGYDRESREIGLGDGSSTNHVAQTAVHEAGHAVDEALGMPSQHPDFMSAVRGLASAGNINPYFDPNTNPESWSLEAFANAFMSYSQTAKLGRNTRLAELAIALGLDRETFDAIAAYARTGAAIEDPIARAAYGRLGRILDFLEAKLS